MIQAFAEQLPIFTIAVEKNSKGKYRVFELEGNSMCDGSVFSICDKDKILCREIQKDLWQYKLHIHNWLFVIVHKTEGVIIKQIIEHDVEKREIKCHSLNSKFEDFILNLDDVLGLYNVIKIVDRNTRI